MDYFKYINESIEYESMLVAMKSEIHDFMENFKDDSRFISGWGHAYFCNEDGGRLIYDIHKPLEHKCSICGRIYDEYMYNACFVTMMRNEAIVTALKSSIMYRVTKEDQYKLIATDIIEFYAKHYHQFTLHAKDQINCSPTTDVGGAGKIMPQGLNEAIIAIRIVNSLELLKDSLDKDWLLMVKETLFAPMFELLVPQKMHIHNIPTWINSAIGVFGLFFQEEKWIAEATKNPFHLFEQLQKGVTESGFWYEGSIHYNFFALEGIMNFFVSAKAYHFEIDQKYQDIVFHMFEAAYDYAFDNDIFPNPSDGWPNISLKTYSYVYYMAYAVFGDKILPYLKHIENNPVPRARLPLSEPYYYDNRIPLTRIMYCPEFSDLKSDRIKSRGSQSFEASNCAILRNDTYNLFFKYGHQTKSHAHPDKMNIEIMVNNQVLTKDLSNSGYASKMCNEWHRKIAAHNTCVIDGMPSDISHPGTLLENSDTHVKASTKAYDGVTYTRDLTIDGTVLTDIFDVELEEKNQIDWFFHYETPVNIDGLKLTPVSMFSEYGRIEEVKEITLSNNSITIENELVSMQLDLEQGMRLYLAKTYNNPADKMRDTLIIRTTSSRARIKSTIAAK
ncbi:heparinase II/III domain-containing protein [Lachnoclostridium sp.]|uniref:heparinase II/III domain-containing protein n=1 Tax=Lachnoclostridium sp. TaxID=2028282 RepID=UPI00289C5C01|nr:heparinase II/III family protein [Lachnoclostridium sp.]